MVAFKAHGWVQWWVVRACLAEKDGIMRLSSSHVRADKALGPQRRWLADEALGLGVRIIG